MSDEDKEANPTHVTTGGYLKVYGYQEAFRRSWDKAEDKAGQYELLRKLPNFDENVFEKIARFRPGDLLRGKSMSGKTVTVTIDGVEHEAIIK